MYRGANGLHTCMHRKHTGNIWVQTGNRYGRGTCGCRQGIGIDRVHMDTDRELVQTGYIWVQTGNRYRQGTYGNKQV